MADEETRPAALRPLGAEERTRRRLAVIGGGLVGLATAWAAAQIGGDQVEVDLYEAVAIAHEGGASVDVTRVFRHAYEDRAYYSRWTAEALGLWRHLESQSERRLYLRTGGVWAAHATDQTATSSGLEQPYSPEAASRSLELSFKTMREVGLPCEMLNSYELRRRYPQFADPTLAKALLDREAGMLFARDALLAFRDVARRFGARMHEGRRAVEMRPSAGGCGVSFADGSSIEADVVVLAANAWTDRLLPELASRVGSPAGPDGAPARALQVTEQPLFYLLPAPSAAEEFEPGRFPVFLFVNTRVYGLPAYLGAVKAANNDPARLLDDPGERRLADSVYQEQLYSFLVRQFPGLRNAALLQERVCYYDRSPDEDFLLDQWDPEARLIVACGFSGHGFKFGPLLGARLARYALSGRCPADLHPFSLARFQHAV